MERLPDSYLFRTIDHDVLVRGLRVLDHFRFFRAYGGHANDGDKLFLRILAPDADHARRVLAELRLPAKPAEREPDSSDIKIKGHFVSFDQIGHAEVLGVPALVWFLDGALEISLAGAGGDPYFVTDADFQNARDLEALLEPLGLDYLDPPLDNPHCLHPDLYPELWEDD